jgi:hypothetical protein
LGNPGAVGLDLGLPQFGRPPTSTCAYTVAVTSYLSRFRRSG